MKILSYKKFREEIVRQLIDYYADTADVEIINVKKLNSKKLEAINITFKGVENQAIPMMYLEDYYDDYKQGEDITECVDKMIECREKCVGDDNVAKNLHEMVGSWDEVKEKIYPQLINTSENQELLDELVNYPFLDLSVIFAIRSYCGSDGVGYIKLSKEIFKLYNISLEELKEQALKNLKGENYHFETMENLLARIIGLDQSVEEDDVEEFMPGELYVLQNDSRCFGAAGILDMDMIKNKLKNMTSFLIPSSVHEIIIAPCAENLKATDINEMIKEVNSTAVKLSERLSDHVYLYDGLTQQVIMCA